MNPLNFIKKLIVTPLLILFVLVLIFYPVLFSDKVMFYRDITIQDYPQTEFITQSLKSGVFPFWNPYMFSGFPQFASIQPPLSYPLIYIYLLFPFHIGLAVFLMIHFFIAFLGVYLIGKKWQFDNSICLMGGLVFALNSYVFEHYIYQYILCAIAWLPYVFLYFEKTLEKNSLKNFLLLTLFSFLFISTGRLDYFYFTGIFLGFYTIFKLLSKEIDLKERDKNLLTIGTSFLFSLLLFAFQLLPMFDFLKNSRRGTGILFEGATSWSLHPLQLLSSAFYNILGDFYNPTGLFNLITDKDGRFFIYNLYLGLIIIYVVIYSLIKSKTSIENKNQKEKNTTEKKSYFLLLSLVFFTILAIGKFTPIYKIFFDYVPLFSNLRYPTKLFFMPVFCISLMFMIGLEKISSHVNKKTNIASIVVGTLFLIIYIATKFFIPETNLTSASFSSLKNETLLFILFSLSYYFFYSEKIRKDSFLKILYLLLLINLGWSAHNTLWLANRNEIYAKSDVADDINKLDLDKKSGYLYKPDKYELKTDSGKIFPYKVFYRSMIWSNFPMMFQIRDMYGYYPGEPVKSSFLYSTLNDKIEGLTLTNEERLDLLRNLSVKFYLHLAGDNLSFSDKNFEIIGQYKDLSAELWSLKESKKRVHFYNKAFVLNNEEEILRRFLKRDLYKIDNETCFIFDQTIPKEVFFNTLTEKTNTESSTEIIDENANYLKIKVNNKEKGILVINDAYDKDWKAYDNGIETKVLEANYMYRGINLASVGEHIIELKYLPQDFIKGSIISLISLVVFILTSIFWYKKKGFE